MGNRNTPPNRRAVLLAAALAPLHAAAQGADGVRIEGSGKIVEDERRLTGFSRLIVQGPLDVTVRKGESEKVVVRAEANITPLIETVVQGDTLNIGLRPGASFRTRSRLQVRVQARRMQGVILRGSGDVRIDRGEAEVFEATLQGSGDLTIDSLRAGALALSMAGNGDFRASGTADSVGVVLDGSGDVYCGNLVAARVAVRIIGKGDVRVHATDELKVDIDGSGDVHYRGAPKISESVRGSGSVKRLS
jgi:hypothetical protein